MKKLLFIIPLFFLLGSCNKDSAIKEKISLENYTHYLNVEINTNTVANRIHTHKYVFSGALSFATYDVQITYSGKPYRGSENPDMETLTLTLNIGGGGETEWLMDSSSTIVDVSGWCKYKL